MKPGALGGAGSGLRRDEVGPGTPCQEVGLYLRGYRKPQMSLQQEYLCGCAGS